MDGTGKAEGLRRELYREAVNRFKMKYPSYQEGPGVINVNGTEFINLGIMQEFNILFDERLKKLLEDRDVREEED